MTMQEQMKIEITQDKLVDILMHSATREDIAKLDDKIEGKIDNLIAEVKRSSEVMEARILTEFRNTTADLNNRLGREFQKIDHRYNWVVGTVIGTGVAVTGVMIAIINFIIKLH